MTTALSTKFIDTMDTISATEWNSLAAAEPPFMRHEFLNALETNGVVTEQTGWTPTHALVRGGSGELLAAAPLYEKTHSWGEFVFDWAWADAYQQHGLAYYPKLVTAAPFTPATSGKILLADHPDAKRARAALISATITRLRAQNLSSWHVHFVRGDKPVEDGWVRRKDCQFHWRNRAYESFDDFLATFSSQKRKKVRRERRRVQEAGIQFSCLSGHDMTEADWNDAYELTRITFLLRGREPYLNLEFFLNVAASMPASFRVVFAQHDDRRVAAAIFIRGESGLYGRYWGALDNFHSLHFETCYYQGIELCIREQLDTFEPGTQGEHKVSRGFEPTATWSDHYLANNRFADAISKYTEREAEGVGRYMDDVRDHVPFRKGETLA